MKLYLESTDDEDNDEEAVSRLPNLVVGQQLQFVQLTATEKFSRPAARYTEASLVKSWKSWALAGRVLTPLPLVPL